MLIKLEHYFDKFSNFIGMTAATLLIIMLINVFYDAIVRYVFKSGHIAMQEMEWHLFSIVFLIGIAYTLKEDGHVRVDVIYDRLSPRTQALINIFGAFFLLMPITWLIITGSFDFVMEAYEFNEISGDPGGLTHRYLIKAMIPVSFTFVMISAIGFVLHNINIFRRSNLK
ncbi:MAG: TRAP transporter small permease subunit [Deltaproteobacteria bacterium]|nr:TRAP transporter small permease subunit [Candidatus Tharpella aukensis]